MQTYRRFVSYVYQYENGKKAGNRGFIKVEARGNTCSMQIALKGVCKDGNGQCKVYGFKREDGLLKGSLLTECPVKTGVVQEQLAFLRSSMGNANYSLHDLSGVIFQGDDQTMYGTQWDDEPMKMENFQPDENNMAQQTSEETLGEESMDQSEEPKDVTLKAGQEEREEKILKELPAAEEEMERETAHANPASESVQMEIEPETVQTAAEAVREEGPKAQASQQEPSADSAQLEMISAEQTQEIAGQVMQEEEMRQEELAQIEAASVEKAQEEAYKEESELLAEQYEETAQEEIVESEAVRREEAVRENILEMKEEQQSGMGEGMVQEKKEQAQMQMRNFQAGSPEQPNPAEQNPVGSSPSRQNPAGAGLAGPGPMECGPEQPNPAEQNPAGSSPSRQNPAGAGLAGPGPIACGPSEPSPSKQNPAGPSSVEQSPVGPSPAGQGPAGQGPAGQNPMRPSPAGQGAATPNPGISVQDPAESERFPIYSDSEAGKGDMPEEITEEGPLEILDTTVDLSQLNLEVEEEREKGGQENYIKPDMEAENVPEKNAAEKRKFCPFTDGVLEDCQRIALEDLMRLDPRDHGLRNNRFVQHGYQMFGHLLLARVARNSQYILGVPGVYQQQEKFMADMFGFHNFKCARRRGSKTPCFGYWYRLIYPPKLCKGNGCQN